MVRADAHGNAVHLFDEFLKNAQPSYDGWICYGMGEGHGWRDLGERELMEQMAAALSH